MRLLREKVTFYAAFLLGGLWLLFCSGVGIVWLLLRPGNRRTLYMFGRVFCRGLSWMMRWDISVENRERLEALRPCVFVGNHQSFLDVVTFGSVFPRNTVSAGKREIGRIPIFGWFYRLSGNLVIDRGNAKSAHESLAAAAETMSREKIAVWFMPEGHRNTGPELLAFKSGAFRLAVAAKIPIVPVVAEPLTVIADTRRRLARPGRLRVRVLDPVLTDSLDEKDIPALVSSVRARMQEALDGFRDRLPSPIPPTNPANN